ncbi:uncharacterized protein A1O9_09623 [Exophiala aquamarina CBS 119918]|uniref:NADP-dependent oxidoreductase domain-containing protein n=1 Tax=Exophiala aquamarina CBS 119918 TaxID=1182545 RepID=A0A072P3M5_9EURO|nr:uncharacterized protein A1O9_09623 [Exophiala aquamarina CBS 119918]KEF54456.1 hypothetical protein A1O9_09623 [Exophiala aquamarina CBS 119918]
MAPTTPVKIILGTHTVGDSAKSPGIAHFDGEKDVQSLLSAFFERGYRDIDTASNYPGSERRLGAIGVPSRFIVHTKVQSGQPGDHTTAKIELSVKKSLDALQTPTVETMFLHVPDRETPFEEAIKTMNDALKQKSFKQYGLSNYSAAEVQGIIDICEQNKYVKPAVYQGHYNAVVRGGEKELFPLLRKHGISFFAYSPAAGGFFSGNTPNANSARWKSENFVGKLYNSIYGDPAVLAAVDTIKEATKKHNISGHAAALRWTAFHSVLDGKFGDGLIFAVSKMDQLHDTLDALEAGPLPDDLAQEISAIYDKLNGKGPAYHL